MTGEPVRLLGGAALGDLVARLLDAVQPARVVQGHATVELDRAEIEVRASRVAMGEPGARSAPADGILGASSRLLRLPGDHDVLLLEPDTEGRLAAALARHGEGMVAAYLLTDPAGADRARRAGFGLSAAAQGPFGAQRLILGGPRDGPFLLLAGLDEQPRLDEGRRSDGT